MGLGELQIQSTEVPVGNFSIDILAQDIEGNIVVIENQFGPTDHAHLGQIMTYVAGQEGDGTVVWIAKTFREEHRAVVDWLNASTIEGFAFFAIEIEALRISDSLPAPRFNVVGKPNAWSRGITRTTRQAGEGTPNERRRFYINYWSEFGVFLAERRSTFRLRRTFKDSWCSFRIGRSGVRIVATAPATRGTRSALSSTSLAPTTRRRSGHWKPRRTTSNVSSARSWNGRSCAHRHLQGC